MKKYDTPKLILSKYELNKDIAALEVNSAVDFDNGTTDKESFENLFG